MTRIQHILQYIGNKTCSRLSDEDMQLLLQGIADYLSFSCYPQNECGNEERERMLQLLPPVSENELIIFFLYFRQRHMADSVVQCAESAAANAALSGELLSEKESQQLLSAFLELIKPFQNRPEYQNWITQHSQDLITALRCASGRSDRITEGIASRLRY